MQSDPVVWGQQIMNDFREENGRFPSEAEFRACALELAPTIPELAPLDANQVSDEIALAVSALKSHGLMQEDMESKIRDAHTNLNNRRYVDGTL